MQSAGIHLSTRAHLTRDTRNTGPAHQVQNPTRLAHIAAGIIEVFCLGYSQADTDLRLREADRPNRSDAPQLGLSWISNRPPADKAKTSEGAADRIICTRRCRSGGPSRPGNSPSLSAIRQQPSVRPTARASARGDAPVFFRSARPGLFPILHQVVSINSAPGKPTPPPHSRRDWFPKPGQSARCAPIVDRRPLNRGTKRPERPSIRPRPATRHF